MPDECALEELPDDEDPEARMGDVGMFVLEDCLHRSKDPLLFPDTDGIPILSENG